MSKKIAALKALDKIRFRVLTTRMLFDTPKTKYQPLPFVGIDDAHRSAGSQTRLREIKNTLDKLGIRNGSVADYGCNVGYFSISLGIEGFTSYGIERDLVALDTAYTASKMVGASFCPINKDITIETIRLMPKTDASICLSLWHHWVKEFGMEDATSILKTLWENTNCVLFFDTGETEMPPEYNLPFMNSDPKEWLLSYFEENLHPEEIIWLGQHKAFAPGKFKENEHIDRNLFAIVKNAKI